MMTSVAALARDNRVGLRAIFVLVVLSTAVALLSHRVFSPWQFDARNVKEVAPSQIPRVAIKP